MLRKFKYHCLLDDGPLLDTEGREAVMEQLFKGRGALLLEGVGTVPTDEKLGKILRCLSSPNDSANHPPILDPFVFVEQRDDIVIDERSFFQFPYKSGIALQCHTDGSYKQNPFDLVALQCLRADASGGLIVLSMLDDLLMRLDPADVQTLLEIPVPFEFGFAPILKAHVWGLSIRYNRREIEAYSGADLDKMRPVLDRLDSALAFEFASELVNLPPGCCLLIDNHRVLHGRTGLSPRNNRLLIRGRCHIENATLLRSNDDFRRQ